MNMRVECGSSFDVIAPKKFCNVTDNGTTRWVTAVVDNYNTGIRRSEVRFSVGNLVEFGIVEKDKPASITISLPSNADPNPNATATLTVEARDEREVVEDVWVNYFEDQLFHPGNCQGTVEFTDESPPVVRVGDVFGDASAEYTFGAIIEKSDPQDVYTFSMKDAPTGLHIDPVSGLIFGTATESGKWQTTISALAYDQREQVSRVLTFEVHAPVKPATRVTYKADGCDLNVAVEHLIGGPGSYYTIEYGGEVASGRLRRGGTLSLQLDNLEPGIIEPVVKRSGVIVPTFFNLRNCLVTTPVYAFDASR